MRYHLACAGLGLTVALSASGAAAGGEPETAFEVIVLRGASVARVSGDASGALREEILREDPRPARREPTPPAPRNASQEIVVVIDAGPGYAAGYGLLAPFYPSRWLAPRPHRPWRRVYRPGSTPPGFHHATHAHARQPRGPF